MQIHVGPARFSWNKLQNMNKKTEVFCAIVLILVTKKCTCDIFIFFIFFNDFPPFGIKLAAPAQNNPTLGDCPLWAHLTDWTVAVNYFLNDFSFSLLSLCRTSKSPADIFIIMDVPAQKRPEKRATLHCYFFSFTLNQGEDKKNT